MRWPRTLWPRSLHLPFSFCFCLAGNPPLMPPPTGVPAGRLASALGIPRAAVARNKQSYAASDADTLSSREEDGWSEGEEGGLGGSPSTMSHVWAVVKQAPGR